ncbi:DUF402 domain-containing protein [Streptomyces sp. LaPpAH-108]|uniref:DUF402 domain-containing protein n=1 Tax=Streptomyces sp. LaPpAH-108 TaxID=1155714 RepID=UPI00055BA6A2|nr:DUF402 domain-containing protein [Streptomyces sp. LaPpAH-108]
MRRDVHHGGDVRHVWSEHALRVLTDTGDVLEAACAPGAETRWPALYAKSLAEDDRSKRTGAFDALAAGTSEQMSGRWRDTELRAWKPSTAWFSVNAFYTGTGLRNWYVNFERPMLRTPDGFDTFDLAVDLLIAPDLAHWQWKDEDEYAHARRLGLITDTDHRAVDAARGEVLAMLGGRAGPFADAGAWSTWRWNGTWATPRLPRRAEAG